MSPPGGQGAGCVILRHRGCALGNRCVWLRRHSLLDRKETSMRRLLFALVLGALAAWPLSAASVDGLDIHSSVTGTGPATLVFVHGWTCDSSSWDAQVPVLAGKYRVVTLDLPGHGKSGAPADGKFSMDLFARA